jgi:N-methylhydantoinase B/oxoprolinase/acetone carboxylase alpha subunit
MCLGVTERTSAAGEHLRPVDESEVRRLCRAMMGALDLAERRLHTLIGDYGLEFVQSACTELLAIAERRMRAEIEMIPDGTYTFEDAIEDDGITTHDYPIRLTLTVEGGSVIADFRARPRRRSGPSTATAATRRSRSSRLATRHSASSRTGSSRTPVAPASSTAGSAASGCSRSPCRR